MLPPCAALDFRPWGDREEQAWSYSFKDGSGMVSARAGTQRQMYKDLREGEGVWCEGNWTLCKTLAT
jgi:hypothetical protein